MAQDQPSAGHGKPRLRSFLRFITRKPAKLPSIVCPSTQRFAKSKTRQIADVHPDLYNSTGGMG